MKNHKTLLRAPGWGQEGLARREVRRLENASLIL